MIALALAAGIVEKGIPEKITVGAGNP